MEKKNNKKYISKHVSVTTINYILVVIDNVQTIDVIKIL